MKITLDKQQLDELQAHPLLRWIRKYRYSFLFGAILAQLALLPFFENKMRIFVPVLFLLIVLTVLFTLDLRKAVFGVCFALGLLSTILFILGRALKVSPATETNYVMVAMILDVVFLSFVLYVLMVKIFAEERVSRETIKGGFSVYFLLGYLWAYLYSIILLLNPQAISFSMPNVELSNIIYFSFTTLTTLGYGDITPVTWMARNLTILESAIGQIFLTVFIARMVGQELANRSLHVRGPNKDK